MLKICLKHTAIALSDGMNPVKAYMVSYAEEYIWSSYRLYLERVGITEENIFAFLDISEILTIFSKDKKRARKLLASFTRNMTDDIYIDIDRVEALKDANDRERLLNGILDARDIKLEDIKKDRPLMEATVRELKFVVGMPGRQVARMLGIDRNIVQRISR